MTDHQNAPKESEPKGFHYLGTYYERPEDIPGLGRDKQGRPRLVVSDEVFFGAAPMPRVVESVDPHEQ